MHHFKRENTKNFLGSPDPTPTGEGDTLSPDHPTPFECLRDSNPLQTTFLATGLYYPSRYCSYSYLHRVSKTVQTYSCQNFVKFRPTVKIFGTNIAERTVFSEVYPFSTSPNLCQRTTVLNADVQNCYLTL